MKEPASCMDRLYNSLNSYRDEVPHSQPDRSTWHHDDVNEHLRRLGAGTHWPMPEVIKADEALKITEKWRHSIYDSWVQLDKLVRERFDHIAFPIRSEKTISDEALSDMIEAAWQTTTEAPLISDVFHDTALPENLKTGLEAWSEISTGLVKDAPYPIPSYSIGPKGTGKDKFSDFEAYVHRHKVAFQIPALNLEQLTNRKLLIMFIVQRTVKTPPYFPLADWEAMHIGRTGRLLSAPFCDGTFMTFLRGRHPEEWHETNDKWERQYVWDGRPCSWDIQQGESIKKLMHPAHGRVLETDERCGPTKEWKFDYNLNLNQRGLVYDWGEGLLVLQAQSAIYRFCLELCRLAEKYSMKTPPLMVPMLPGWPENKPGSWDTGMDMMHKQAIHRFWDWVPEDEKDGTEWRPEPPGLDIRRMSDSAIYTLEEIRQWREASDQRIYAVGDTWPSRVPDHEIPEGQYQEGYNFHYGWIPDGAGGKANSQDLLEHMFSTEFNAKKVIANDVIRRCLRFLIFATEISYALALQFQHLGLLLRPMQDHYAPDEEGQGMYIGGKWGFPDHYHDFHDHPLGIFETREAYLRLVLHLRWFNEILFTHLHGQAIVHGSAGCRSLCDRDHVSKKSLVEGDSDQFDKHGHLRYKPLPLGLKGVDRPPIPTYNPKKLAKPLTESTAELSKLLEDVEKGPPNADYGIPTMKNVAASILSRIDTVSTMEDQIEVSESTSVAENKLFGSKSLVRDAAFIVSQLADILTEMEVVDPLRSARHLLNDPDIVKEYELSCDSNRVLQALDDFNFEATIPADGIRPLHEMIGVRYSNSDKMEMTRESAQERLEQFRRHLYKFFIKKGCWEPEPETPKDGKTEDDEPQPENTQTEVVESGKLKSLVYVSDFEKDRREDEARQATESKKARQKAGEPEPPEPVKPDPKETMQLTNIFGTISTKDPKINPPKRLKPPMPGTAVEPPPLAGLNISGESSVNPGPIAIKNPDVGTGAVLPTTSDEKQAKIDKHIEAEKQAREQRKAFVLGWYDAKEEKRKSWKTVKVPDMYATNSNLNSGAVIGPGAQEFLSNRDWATVSDTFGKTARQKGSIRWQHFKMLLIHMGFQLADDTGSSAVKFVWTPASKIPEPSQKVSSLHGQHRPGKNASIDSFRVRNWCNTLEEDFGLTEEVIEKAYGQGRRGARRAMMVTTFDPFDVDMGEEWAEYWNENEEFVEVEESESGDSSGSRKRKADDQLEDLFEEDMRELADRDGGKVRRMAHLKKVRFA
ncbi:hypothetical protein F5X68DRAFT_249485 [Plectosphaerella plurivora]|uniref:Uncharacterized protein n=1 Tax=Plectosphaerella plurivora TaxID=936078 RepID=A0A9P8V2R2_9PEZI|nr:hypothetical protein F5X68DRAFT_249485 [Plectosphaerella plurivora]